MTEIKIEELEKINGGSSIGGGKESISLLEAVVEAMNRACPLHPGFVDKLED